MDDLLNNGQSFVDEFKKIFQILLTNEYSSIDLETLRLLYLKIKAEHGMMNQLHRALSSTTKELKTASTLINQSSADFTQADVQTLSNFDIFEKIDFKVRKGQSSSTLAPIWAVYDPQFAALFEKHNGIPHNRIVNDKYVKPDYMSGGTHVFATTWSGPQPADASLLAAFDKELVTLLNSFFTMIPMQLANTAALKTLKVPVISSTSPDQQKLFSKYLIPEQFSNNILFTISGGDKSRTKQDYQAAD